MYGSHPLGTYSKREVHATASRASRSEWRTTAGRAAPVAVRQVAPVGVNLDARRNALYGF